LPTLSCCLHSPALFPFKSHHAPFPPSHTHTHTHTHTAHPSQVSIGCSPRVGDACRQAVTGCRRTGVRGPLSPPQPQWRRPHPRRHRYACCPQSVLLARTRHHAHRSLAGASLAQDGGTHHPLFALPSELSFSPARGEIIREIITVQRTPVDRCVSLLFPRYFPREGFDLIPPLFGLGGQTRRHRALHHRTNHRHVSRRPGMKRDHRTVLSIACIMCVRLRRAYRKFLCPFLTQGARIISIA
jgi:hypothetical protein